MRREITFPEVVIVKIASIHRCKCLECEHFIKKSNKHNVALMLSQVTGSTYTSYAFTHNVKCYHMLLHVKCVTLCMQYAFIKIVGYTMREIVLIRCTDSGGDDKQ